MSPRGTFPYRGNNPDYGGELDRDVVEFEGGMSPPPAKTRPGALSGQAVITSAIGTIARPQNGTQVVRWMTDDELAVPLVVHVDVRGPNPNTASAPFASQVAYMAGADGAGATTTRGLGVLRFTYGVGNAVRVIDADLKTGTYQLPPSSSCTVEAFLYGYFGSATRVTVSAAVAPGLTHFPTRPFNTIPVTLNAGLSQLIQAPFGARWVGLAGGVATGVGAGQPHLVLTTGGIGPAIVQDWTTGTFVGAPNAMVELSHRVNPSLRNNGGTSVESTVRFGLEF